MRKESIKPQLYQSMAQAWVKQARDSKLQKKGADQEDIDLASLVDHPGWNNLKAHIEVLKSGIDDNIAQGVAKGLSAEEIGHSTVLAVLAKQLLDSIIHKVEDASLAVTEVIDDDPDGD